jgi:RNA polymerase sigma factor for flagellar operon FliA
MSRTVKLDSSARDELLTKHYALVFHVATSLQRKLSSEASLDDLVSAGTLGLMAAADKFDATRGLAFSTFAVPRIRGAILDDLRAQDRAARSLRPRARALSAARDTVSARGHAPANDSAVAAELGVSVETVWAWDADVAASRSVSIDRSPLDEDERTPWQFACPDQTADETLEKEDARETLVRALEQLPARERQVLSLYYFEELTQSQIAQVLGVTESRVSQLRTKAVAKLREFAPLREAVLA